MRDNTKIIISQLFSIVSTAIVIWLVIAQMSQPKWTAIYYPNRADLSGFITVTKIGSIEECRYVINGLKAISSGENENDYECGYKCKFNGYTYVCKETLK